MTTSTINRASLTAAELQDGTATSSGVARNVRRENRHGHTVVVWNDDTPEFRIAELDAVIALADA